MERWTERKRGNSHTHTHTGRGRGCAQQAEAARPLMSASGQPRRPVGWPHSPPSINHLSALCLCARGSLAASASRGRHALAAARKHSPLAKSRRASARRQWRCSLSWLFALSVLAKFRYLGRIVCGLPCCECGPTSELIAPGRPQGARARARESICKFVAN